ncbi:Endoglucanase-5 [Arthrobotrys entomopaga]|nr:Endoglucanase-5 [Arthrobotrys entomopaga]
MLFSKPFTMKAVAIIAALAGTVSAQQSVYSQCGGVNWTGGTTCVSGSTCVFVNDYYWQCLPVTSSTTTTTTTTTSHTTSTTTTSPHITTTTTTTPHITTTTTTTSHTSTSAGSGPTFTPIVGGASGVGKTTRYWDCCKASCAWSGKGPVIPNVCDINGDPITNNPINAQSGCDGGPAFMCIDQQPFVINDDVAYGFAAVNIQGRTEQGWCCSCYALSLTDGPAAGKTFVVQATNTGGDLVNNQFDLALPGGGQGLFNGCSKQFPDTPFDNWGATYGGIDTRDQCAGLPAVLQPGCDFRFDWFEGSDNPNITFVEVKCPPEIVAISGCTR